jgi:hypothetical protein
MFTAYINTQIMPNTWENETTVKPPTRPTFPHYPTLLAAGCVGDILELCSIHDQAALWPAIVSQQNAVCQSRTKPVPEWYHIQIKWVWVKLSNYPYYPLMVNDNPSGASISTDSLVLALQPGAPWRPARSPSHHIARTSATKTWKAAAGFEDFFHVWYHLWNQTIKHQILYNIL